MSSKFLKDGSVATEWAKNNKPLFDYLAEELKLRDPATFIKMNGTLLPDNIIRHKGVKVSQNAKRAIKSRKRQEEEGSEWQMKCD